jgi:hypothetical protein
MRNVMSLLAGLLFAILAAPLPAAAGTGRTARTGKVSFAPLFDTNARLHARQAVQLRFRAAGHVPALADVSVSLRRGPHDGEMRLPIRRVKGGVFEVPFAPLWPGQYLLAIEVRGVKRPASQVTLGVVGVAPGLVEVPPEEDAQALRQWRTAGRTVR